MAASGYENEKEQVVVVQQLNELFGNKLNLDLIKSVAKTCQFDVNQSSNELLEIANRWPYHQPPMKPSSIKMSTSPSQSPNKSKKAVEIERVLKEINDGFKVLIILRGLPGSGKSTLAKSILENTIGYSAQISAKHILSTDDFFMNNGFYQFDPDKLSEAHGWNHQRAFNLMSKGFSPVIIDNTNTQMWEMKPYALMATDYGYILEILEPDTHWCFNEKELEKRNKHNVSKASIKNMLERYQKNVTPMKLLTAYDCKYKLQKPPQYRLHPPLQNQTTLQTAQKKLPEPIRKPEINFMDFQENKPQSSSIDDLLMNDSSQIKAPVLKPMHTAKIKQSTSLFDNFNMKAWGIDEKAVRSWDIYTPLNVNEPGPSPIVIDDDDFEFIPEKTDMSIGTEDCDFIIMKNLLIVEPPKPYKVLETCSRDINRNVIPRQQSIAKKLMIDKSCLTEDFIDDHVAHLENLAKVFPNISAKSLKYWYGKCNYDFDCTIELLLTEKDEVINTIVDDNDKNEETNNEAEAICVDSDSSNSSNTPKSKRKIYNSSSSEETQELKKYIESKVNINEGHYSEKLRKIRQARYNRNNSSTTNCQINPESAEEPSSPMDMEDFEFLEPSSIANENIETVELNLGDHFVKQLEDNFGDPNLVYPKGFQPVIQMPVALARQLYTFYIESVYQQMDAQNLVMEALEKEDEEFARKLQEEEKEEVAVISNTEPTEIPEIMREQKVLSKWQKESEKWKEDTPDTLAARLTREKLFNSFPLLDKNTLLEILHAHENVYKDTVETLLASSNLKDVNIAINGDVEAFKQPPINTEIMDEMWKAHESCQKEEGQSESCSAENYREEANRYLEKRQILYEKAQRYYQQGLKEVAQFYSALASKQTRLYETANSLAATAFLDEHSKRLEDFNTLDLHFLYVKEAIPTLDIFLDRNINLLRMSTSKNSECLQIITGRGKNSKNGVAKIRPAVISRLTQRNISYQVLNPGLLKIKITKVSNVTSEL